MSLTASGSGLPISFSNVVTLNRTFLSGIAKLPASNCICALSCIAVQGVTPLTLNLQTTNQLPTFSTYVYPPGYLVSASSETTPAWQAFDKNTATQWTSAQTYTGTTGLYSGAVSTLVSGVPYTGEWIQIQLPASSNLFNFSLSVTSGSLYQAPLSWRLAGSNDGSTWSTVYAVVDIPFTAAGTFFYAPQYPSVYSYYRLIVNVRNQNSTDGYLSIPELGLGVNTPTRNFYAQRLGELLTIPASGITFQNWNSLSNALPNVLTWYDQSGQGNHATQQSNVGVVNFTPSFPYNVQIVNPINTTFSGTATNYFALPPMNLTPASTGITAIVRVAFLAASSGQNSYERIIDFGIANGSLNGNITIFRIGTSSTIGATICNGTTQGGVQGGLIIQNRVTTIAMKFDPKTQILSMYQDGVYLAGTSAAGAVQDAVRPYCYIGRSANNGGDNMFTGLIYGFQFYNAALPDSLISSTMLASF